MDSRLRDDISKLSRSAGCASVAVALHDHETGLRFSFEGDRFFHAASTIKVAIMIALLKAVETGTVRLDDWLHVRNRFRSMAGGEVFRIDSGRDADPEVHRRVGRAMRIGDLARTMIVRSSNLATNLILDLIGIEFAREVIGQAGLGGINLQRGVEDTRAFQQGINNEVNAEAMVGLFGVLLREGVLASQNRHHALEILLDQQFTEMIPAGLPDDARVAHKTGEISTVCHDAGIVYLPGRKPYVLAILTEWAPDADNRKQAVAGISRLVYEFIRDPHPQGK